MEKINQNVKKEISKIPKVEKVDSSTKVNQFINDESKAEIEEKMVLYLKEKGYDVTPSGNPIKKETVIHKATEAVSDTVVGTGHVARGIFRSIKNKISDKVTELRTIGS